MKINSASDDSASFSISARMRVKLRALDQDSQNVQNGAAYLNAAEGGIQGQIDLLRTIRAKVIDAANDSNSDEDRRIIQKELTHLYTQIENLAYDTDYNTQKPLLGDTLVDKLGKLVIATPSLEEQSDINLIPDNYATLDGIEGPFDIFTEYSEGTVFGTHQMSGGEDGKPKIMTLDFSKYTDVSQLNNVGLKIYDNNSTRTYILTDDTSKIYEGASYKVPLGNSIDDAINNLVKSITSSSSGVSAERDGMKINVETKSKTANANSAYIEPSARQGRIVDEYENVPHNVAGAGVSGTTSGGVDNPTKDPDLPPATKATLTIDLSGTPDDSGFSFDEKNFHINAADPNAKGDESNVKLTKGKSASGSAGNFSWTFDGKSITFTANHVGSSYNGRGVTNGYTYNTHEPTGEKKEYTGYTGFDGAIETTQQAEDGKKAFWYLDVSTVDEFSEKYSGKSITSPINYKFYDSSLAPKLEGLREDDGSRQFAKAQIDINDIRKSVAAGKSFAEAFKSAVWNSSYVEVEDDKVKFLAGTADESGNNQSVTFNNDDTLRHYDVNFSDLDGTINMPRGLYGKGFRFYCATDSKEWFNIAFTDGKKVYETELENIKSINVDVSKVTNSAELVQAIYDQAGSMLGEGGTFNHHMRLAADPDKGIVTVYDHRRFSVKHYPDYQEMGAKIADGISLTDPDAPEEAGEREFLVREFIVQHTDKANMNIRLVIPQMTLDQIFDPLPDPNKNIFDYTVTTADNRNALLGNPNPPGILDNGLKYLLDAITLVGAQNSRLAYTATNITTEMENLTASESTIRDADMAKEMIEYTKSNLLTQSSQSMLAQANQNSSMVLGLLG